jgi:NYN domain
MSEKLTVSLYVDNQNVKLNLELANLLLVFAKIQGIVKQAKIYDFWPNNGKNAVLENLANLGFQCISVTSPIKDCADYQLVFDSLSDFDANGWPDLVILVSGDGDFCPFGNHLKKIGIKTIIFARKGNVKKQLMDLADEFHFLDELPELVVIQDAPENEFISELVAPKIDNLVDKLPEVKPQVSSLPDSDVSADYITYDQAIDSLIKAIKSASFQGQPTTFSVLNILMRNNPDYYLIYKGVASIRKADGSKFQKFTNFIEAAVSDGKVRVQKNGNIQEVFLIDPAPSEISSEVADNSEHQTPADSINTQENTQGNTPGTSADYSADYIPYDEAVNCLLEAINTCLLEDHITNLSYISTLMRYNHRFPNYHGVNSIRKADGSSFTKFGEFIDAVAQDGKVRRKKTSKMATVVLVEEKDGEKTETTSSYKKSKKSKNKKKKASHNISYHDAVKCLISAIQTASKQGKEADPGSLDRLMRENKRFPNYQGVKSIFKPNSCHKFSKFIKFLDFVEKDGKIYTTRTRKKITSIKAIDPKAVFNFADFCE